MHTAPSSQTQPRAPGMPAKPDHAKTLSRRGIRPERRPGLCGLLGAAAGPEEAQKGTPRRAARGFGHRPRSRPPRVRPAPGRPRHGSALFRCSGTAPSANSLPRAADASPSAEYELPAASSDLQLRGGADRVTPCSMKPSHWLGASGRGGASGNAELRGGARAGSHLLPRHAGSRELGLPLHAGKWSVL